MSAPFLLDFAWELPRGVRAAFTTREGGASLPPRDSFNPAAHVGDDPGAVLSNRAALRRELALPAEPAWLSQVHGVDVSDIDLPAPGGAARTADASVASARDSVCAILVADCLPVLFASRDGMRIGAAHAGWRGLAAGVLERSVAALAVRGEELTAWIGPGIGAAQFEVGDEVRAAFVDSDPGAAPAFTANSRGRWQADLVALARRRLRALGITEIHGGQWCTFTDRGRFFSFRRDGQCGRMAALIWFDGNVRIAPL